MIARHFFGRRRNRSIDTAKPLSLLLCLDHELLAQKVAEFRQASSRVDSQPSSRVSSAKSDMPLTMIQAGLSIGDTEISPTASISPPTICSGRGLKRPHEFIAKLRAIDRCPSGQEGPHVNSKRPHISLHFPKEQLQHRRLGGLEFRIRVVKSIMPVMGKNLPPVVGNQRTGHKYITGLLLLRIDPKSHSDLDNCCCWSSTLEEDSFGTRSRRTSAAPSPCGQRSLTPEVTHRTDIVIPPQGLMYPSAKSAPALSPPLQAAPFRWWLRRTRAASCWKTSAKYSSSFIHESILRAAKTPEWFQATFTGFICSDVQQGSLAKAGTQASSVGSGSGG